MGGVDALQSVQFATVNGRRVAVIDGDEWEARIEWLETLEDWALAHAARGALRAASGERKGAGWLNWNEVREQLH